MAITGALDRLFDRYVVRRVKDEYATVLLHAQLGVRLRGTTEIMVYGIDLAMELNPTFALVKLDLENAYNTVRRLVVLQQHSIHPHQASWVPYLRSKLRPKGMLYTTCDHAEVITSAEGLLHGSPLSSAPSR